MKIAIPAVLLCSLLITGCRASDSSTEIEYTSDVSDNAPVSESMPEVSLYGNTFIIEGDTMTYENSVEAGD